MGGESPDRTVGRVSELVVGHNLPVIGRADLQIRIGIVAGGIVQIQIVYHIGGRIVGTQIQTIAVRPDIAGLPAEHGGRGHLNGVVQRKHSHGRIGSGGGGRDELDVGPAVGAGAGQVRGKGRVLSLVNRHVIGAGGGITEGGIACGQISVPVFEEEFNVLISVPGKRRRESDVMPATSVVGKGTLKQLGEVCAAGISVICGFIDRGSGVAGVNALVGHLVGGRRVADIETDADEVGGIGESGSVDLCLGVDDLAPAVVVEPVIGRHAGGGSAGADGISVGQGYCRHKKEQ